MEAWQRVDDADVRHHRLSQHCSNITLRQCGIQCCHIIELHYLGGHCRVHRGSNVACAWRGAAVRPGTAAQRKDCLAAAVLYATVAVMWQLELS